MATVVRPIGVMARNDVALGDRQVIAQAVRLLMTAGGCSADEAIVQLADRASAYDREIRNVAAGIVARARSASVADNSQID